MRSPFAGSDWIMKDLEYDPILKEAAEEFKELCKKYDIFGVTLLVSSSHAEFIHRIDPSWSCMKVDSEIKGGIGIIFKSKLEDFDSKEDQHEATESTIHALTSIVEWSRQMNNNFQKMLVDLSNHMRIAWKPWKDPDSVRRFDS